MHSLICSNKTVSGGILLSYPRGCKKTEKLTKRSGILFEINHSVISNLN